MTEVNIYLAMKYFIWEQQEKFTLLQFRKHFAWALIYNDFIDEENCERRESKRKKIEQHKLEKPPPFSRSYIDGKWTKGAKKPYQQYKCRTVGCKKQVRTYCSCTVGHWLCSDCFVKHCIECNT